VGVYTRLRTPLAVGHTRARGGGSAGQLRGTALPHRVLGSGSLRKVEDQDPPWIRGAFLGCGQDPPPRSQPHPGGVQGDPLHRANGPIQDWHGRL